MTDVNHEEQSIQSIRCPRFKPETRRLQTKRVTTTSTSPMALFSYKMSALSGSGLSVLHHAHL